MTTASSSRILRAPGRIVVNPTEDFNGNSFPYGGTEVGKVRGATLRTDKTLYPVQNEGLGEPGDYLEGEPIYTFSFFLRGWDPDGVTTMLNYGVSQTDPGEQTGYPVFVAPSFRAGRSARTRAIKLVYVPDDKDLAPGCVIYYGIPDLDSAQDMMWSRSQELGVPVSILCHRADTASMMLAVGLLDDLSVSGSLL